jgi:protein TonB
MKSAWIIGVIAAVVLHVGFILFGGLIFNSDAKGQGSLTKVELLDLEGPKEKPKEPPPEKPDDVKTEDEKPPDDSEVVKKFEEVEAAKTPRLDAISLSDMENLLKGASGGDFGRAMSLESGGKIGGTGTAGRAVDQTIERAFDLSEIDQKPRAVYQVAPTYPAEMRGQKLEGVVSVIFIVDSAGKVINLRAEKATHDAFKTPAVDAVKQWKFEPAIRGGQRVACKMRVSIRFQRS